MRWLWVSGCVVAAALLAGCGGSEHPADAPAAEADAASTPAESTPAEPATSKPDDTKPDDAPPKASASVPAPAFKENGTVLEAVNAVPQGTPRLNIEQEELGRPLGNVELYESCKPGNAHFKAKVAVWDGKAVGLDLTTTPKNPKLAACLAERIRSITWPDKVKSLNIVEYTF